MLDVFVQDVHFIAAYRCETETCKQADTLKRVVYCLFCICSVGGWLVANISLLFYSVDLLLRAEVLGESGDGGQGNVGVWNHKTTDNENAPSHRWCVPPTSPASSSGQYWAGCKGL